MKTLRTLARLFIFSGTISSVVLFAISCSKVKEPERFAFVPAETLIILAFDDPKTLEDPAVKPYGPDFLNYLKDVGLEFRSLNDPMFLFMQNSGGCMFGYSDPVALLSKLNGNKQFVDGHEVRVVPRSSGTSGEIKSSVWWTRLSNNVVVFGGELLVTKMIAIAEHKAENLFQTRSELQPMLAAYERSNRVLLLFQSSADSEVSGKLGTLSYLVLRSPEGQVFRMLTSARGLAFSLNHDASGCEQDIGIQFSGYIASKVAWGISSILPWGPNEIQPVSTQITSGDNLTQIHARYNSEQCPRIGLGFQRLPLIISSQTLDSYAGTYVNAHSEITVFRVGERLFSQSDLGKSELQPRSETVFRIVNSTNGSNGTISFIHSGNRTVGFKFVDDNGKVQEYQRR